MTEVEIRIAANGYQYSRTEEGWRLTHHLIAEAKLARRVDSSQERVIFIDKDRSNLDPENIDVVPKKSSKANRIATIRNRIQALQEELSYLEKGS